MDLYRSKVTAYYQQFINDSLEKLSTEGVKVCIKWFMGGNLSKSYPIASYLKS